MGQQPAIWLRQANAKRFVGTLAETTGADRSLLTRSVEGGRSACAYEHQLRLLDDLVRRFPLAFTFARDA